MNKKNTFFAAFLTVVFVSTFIILSLYPNVRSNVKYDEYALGSETVQGLTYLMMEKCEELNPEYDSIKFDESIQTISDETKNKVREIVKSQFSQYIYQLENDSNFGYEISYKDQVISHNMPQVIDESKALYYNKIAFDENSLQSTTNYDSNLFDYWDKDDLFYTYHIANFEINEGTYNAIELNLPKEISYTFYIPKELVSNNKIIVNSLNFPDAFMQFSMFSCLFVCTLILIFLLVYPYKYQISTRFFQSFLKMKFEIALIFYSVSLSLLIPGCMYISGLTLNGSFERWLDRYKISEPAAIIYLSNFVVYATCFLLIGTMIVYIKNMTKIGFIRFIKNNTLVASLIQYIKHKLDVLTQFDLANDLNKKLLLFISINTLICIILCSLWAFGILLAIGYGILCFLYLKQKIAKIQKDYLSILEHAMSLAQGNFDNKYNEDAGVFDSLEYELSRIQVAFESSLKERIKSQNLKTELITNVSHDLKTPLTGMKNYLELLDDPALDDKTRNEYLKIISNYTDRLNNLIVDLFEVSKANSGDIELDLNEINIIEFLEQIHAENAPLLEDKNLILVFDPNQKDIRCLLDPNKSVRIFENLISNISKYALENTRVFVDVKEEPQFVTITYKNISKTYLNFDPSEITERFVRGDSSRHESGSGLGLAIIKSFVEVQNGRFKIEIDGDVFKAIVQFPI